jgi:hypothetical protein
VTTAEDVTAVDRLEAEIRTTMALRAGLVGKPATHGKRAELLREIDDMLEEYNLVTLGR